MSGNAERPSQPTTLIAFLWLILKGLVQSIPKIIKKLILKLVIVFAVMLIINTYLLVYKNEGFAPTNGNKFLSITALKDMYGLATTFWSLTFFFLITSFHRIRSQSIKVYLLQVFTSPIKIIDDFKHSNHGEIGIFFILSGVTTFAFSSVNNAYLIGLISIMVFLSYTLRETSLIGIGVKLGMDDFNRLFSLLSLTGGNIPAQHHGIIFAVLL